MQKKILHFVTDEKFTDYAIKQFSAPEMCSEFVLIPSNDGSIEVKHISKCQVIHQGSNEFFNLLSSLGQYSAIILHGMHWPNWQVPLIDAIPEDVKVAWVFWGGELYGQPDIANKYLAYLDKFANRLHCLHRTIMRKKHPPLAFVPKENYTKINYCLTSMSLEYEFAKQYLNKPKLKHLWYNYYSIEETLGSMIDKQCYGTNIWIGNSATISCNYFDFLLKIKDICIGDRKIIIPLSYGSPWLIKRVPQVYSILFRTHLEPLRFFLPRDQYNEKMLSCSVMIQPHYLSQGVGNIISGLWLGMRVYLSEQCITYKYLKQIGIVVFSIERDFKKTNPTLLMPLPQKIIDHNREILMRETSLQRTIEANKHIVKVLTTDQ